MDASAVPNVLPLDVAYRAAFHLAEQYVSLETQPDVGLGLFLQYLQSDPARWDDWKTAVQKAVAAAGDDPLTENIGPLG